jgi:biopolymer transport protein ExbD
LAAQNNQASGPIAGINVTPLVDIMLVLLIIFLVTAKLTMTPPAAIPLNLPRSASGEAVQTIFSVALGRDGSATVNGKRLGSDDEIKELARAALAAQPQMRAVLQADGQVMHERVIHVVDLLSQAGVSQIAFGVQLAAAKPTPPASP